MRTTARHVHSAMPLFLGAMLTSLSLDARSWPEGVPLGTAAAAIVAFFVAAEATPVHGSACFALSFGTLSWLVPHVAPRARATAACGRVAAWLFAAWGTTLCPLPIGDEQGMRQFASAVPELQVVPFRLVVRQDQVCAAVVRNPRTFAVLTAAVLYRTVTYLSVTAALLLAYRALRGDFPLGAKKRDFPWETPREAKNRKAQLKTPDHAPKAPAKKKRAGPSAKVTRAHCAAIAEAFVAAKAKGRFAVPPMELRKAAGIASAADFETAVDKLKTDGLPGATVPGLEAGKLLTERMVVHTGTAAPADAEPRAAKLLSFLATKGDAGVQRNTALLTAKAPEYSAAELDLALGAWEADGLIRSEDMLRWRAD